MAKGAVKLQNVGGRLVSGRSKTGNPACSQAMSEWVRGRKTGNVASWVFAILGKCRAQARMLKMGGVHEAAGNAAKAAVLRARAARGLTASERAAKAKQLRGARQRPTLPGMGPASTAPAPNARAMAARLANARTPHMHGEAQAANRAWRGEGRYKGGDSPGSARKAYKALDLHARTVEREQIIPGYKANEPRAAAERMARALAKPAPAAAPAAGGWSLMQQSAQGKKAFKTANLFGGKTGTMFDMKKGDLPGQVSLMDRVRSVHTHEGTKPTERGQTISRQRSTLTRAPKAHSIEAHDRATAKRLPKPVKMVTPSKASFGGPAGPGAARFPTTGPAWESKQFEPIREKRGPSPAGPLAAIKSARERQLKDFGATLFDGPNTPYHKRSTAKSTPTASSSAQISASSAPAAASSSPQMALDRGRRMLEERSRTAARLKAAAAVKREQEHPETHGKAGKSYELDTKSIHFDPDRFQYKLAAQGSHGTTEALKDVKKWNPDLAGVVSVWKDPANGKTFVVNGHHRLDLANKLNVGKINARYIDAPNHVEARAMGAMVNIAEGRGTATDAAKFFRDRKIGPGEAAAEGVSLREHTANQGLAMAGLSDHAFKRVVNQEINPARAAIIGGSGLTHAQQDQLLKVLDKPRNKNLTDGTVRNMVDSAKAAGSRTKTTHDLFGSNEEEEALGIHRAKAEDAIKRDLAGDKRLFGLVSKSKAAKSLEERGASRIDTDTTGKIGHEAGAVLDVFDLLKHKDPHISKPLNEAAERIANGENPKTVHAETRAKVTARIKAILEGDVDPFA